MASGGDKNGPAKVPPGAIDLDAPYPKNNPTVAPLPPDPEFAEEISEDLLEDAAEALKLLHPIKPQPTPEKGISLEDIGVHLQMQIQTRHTTQKIYIQGLPPEEERDLDETVVDLEKAAVPAQDPDADEMDTQSMDRRIFEEAQKKRMMLVSDRMQTLHDVKIEDLAPREDDDTNDI